MTTYDFSVYLGDTYNGAAFTINRNSAPLNLTGASLRMDIRPKADQAAVKSLSVGSGLSITNAATGQFQIDEQKLDGLFAGTFVYDIEITIGTWVKTYIRGKITVIQDISHA